MEKLVRFGWMQSGRQFALSLFFIFVVHQLCAQQTVLLEWAKSLSGNVVGYSVALDASGNVYTTGYLEGTADFDPGAGVFNLTSAGLRDIFVSKLDPNGNFVWAKVMGGTQHDDAYTITIDASGNVFTYGLFRGTADFDPGPGTFNLTSAGCYFISKLDNNGNFVFAKAIQAPNASTYSPCKLIVTDPSGNIYVAGDFGGTGDFDPGPGVFNMTANGTDVFVSKLDNNGNLIWAKLLTGINNQESRSIALDAAGNVYTTGILGFTMDFDPGPGVFNLTSMQNDVFISKLDTDGNFVWAKQMTVPSNSDTDFPDAITIDGSGNIYTLGLFSGTVDFDPGPGVVNLTAVAPYNDIFVSKWDPNGNFLWATTTGGDTNSEGSSIVTDAAGNVYALGRFSGTVDFDPGASVFNLTSAGISDVYVSKLDPSGNFMWAQSSGGVSTDFGASITIDGAGKLYTTGYFTGPADFDPGACVFNLAGQMFVQKLFPGTSPTPTIASFSPLAGTVGTAVTITGTNFSATPANNAVSFFNNKTATVTTSTSTSINTSVPVGATTGKISVTVNCITVQSATNFVVGAAPPPTIDGFAPASGPIGTTVTITGTNFSTTPTNNIVYFGATQAVVSAATAAQLSVTVPVGATYESISVSVGGLTAHAPRPFVVTFSGGGNIDNCSFAPSTTIATVPTFVGPGFADVDGDGKPDMLIPNYTTSNFLSVFRNIGTVGSITPGSFAPKIDFATGTQPVSVAVGDLDGDGKRDIAVINYRGGKLSVFKNQSTPGSISLAAKVDFTIPDFADDVSIADMDGDGKLDLTITTSLVGLTVLRNTGTPGIINASTFAAGINFATGPNAFPFVLGDMDGDGKLDVAVPNANAYFVSLLRNTSSPGVISFATQSLTITTGSPAVGGGTLYTVLGDIDGDAKLDLVVTTNTVNTVSVFRNTSVIGALTFDPKFDIIFSTTRNTPALSDLDGDGKIELIVDRTTTEISVYKNVSSTGVINATSFGTPVIIPRSASTVLLTGDVDGDGRSEIISSSSALQVFRNVIGTISSPTIASFSPASGLAGTSVTIHGSNFSTPFLNTVEFNGVPATITGSTATTLTVTVPAAATTGPIKVAIGCNVVFSTDFVIALLPSIASFSPANGPIGTTVDITGVNFSTTPVSNTVKFNGTTATVSAASTTLITTTVPVGATTGQIFVTVAGNTATSATSFTVTASPPVITTQSLTTQVGGIVTLNLVPLITTANNNLDINSIQVSAPPASGAIATVTSGVLRVDYTGIGFIGIEEILIYACDLNSNCATQQYSIDVVGEIVVYNAMSPNGANPTLVIKNIELLPETKGNNVIIYDRWQNEVWHGKDYDNSSVVFAGISDNGSDLPTGTYYYRVEFEGGRKSQTGFISLKR